MKKRNLFIAALLVAAATTVAVVSCKKESQDKTLNNSEQTVESADNMDEYLMAFKKKLLSAEKGGETITYEQAQRNLCNLLNFDFDDSNYATNMFQYDTLRSKLDLTNDGQVDLSQLAIVYNDLFSQIREVYNQVTLPEKSVYSIFCCFSENTNTKGEKVDVEAILTTRGFSNENASELDYLDWRPMNLGGSCDGTIQSVGAPEIVAGWLNSNLGLYGCPDGQARIYLSEIDLSYKNALCDDMIDLNSPCGYKLYVSLEPNQNTVCLSHSELVYYYNQARTLWDDYDNFLPTKPSDHVPVHYEIAYLASYNHVNGQYVQVPPYYWQFKVFHAKIHCSPLPPEV